MLGNCGVERGKGVAFCVAKCVFLVEYTQKKTGDVLSQFWSVANAGNVEMIVLEYSVSAPSQCCESRSPEMDGQLPFVASFPSQVVPLQVERA